MIKVALGTEKYQFDRLMEWLDKAIEDKVLSDKEEILVQSGATTYTPKHKNIIMVPSVPFQQQMAEFGQATISIIHAGIGNVLDLVDLNKVPIIVPRDPMRKEHIDGHQMDFCQVAAKELELPIVYTYHEFVEAIKHYNPNRKFPTFKKQLVEYLVSVVES